jgi:hypothetical protein
VNPADSLELAKFLDNLKSGPPREAAIRGACGRAYYAAFGVIRDALLAVPISVPKDGTAHGLIIKALKNSASPDVAAVGSLLDQLRERRNRADYRVGSLAQQPFTDRDSQVAVALAYQSITDIRRLAKTDRRLGI